MINPAWVSPVVAESDNSNGSGSPACAAAGAAPAHGDTAADEHRGHYRREHP